MLQRYDSRNDDIHIYVGGKLLPRSEARVSVFDSSVQGGDAVWEGLRVYQGRIFCLNEHLQRLHESARALAFTDIPDKQTIKQAIFDTLQANGMRDETHIRLTLSRGEKITSGMDPRLNRHGACLIVLAEWKAPVYDNSSGIRLVTASTRRNTPLHLDSKIHHNNLLNNILAKIEANVSGADDAVMLCPRGFVAETNATNLFMAKNGTVHTPLATACLPGITRSLVLDIAVELGIPCQQRDISLVEFYNADEVWTSGTMGELTPVREIDGRTIINSSGIHLLERIRERFRERTRHEGEVLPF